MAEGDKPQQRQHPILVVAKRTGLAPDVLRAWERRYAAVKPARSATNRRLYSDSDIERLQLLRRATRLGRSIGQVARLSNPELLDLVASDEGALADMHAEGARLSPELPAHEHLAECIEAVERLDGWKLEGSLSRASVALGRQVLIEQVLLPLFEKIGDLWSIGTLRVVHEHLASAVVRSFLGALHEAGETLGAAPHLVVTTPSGQRHEFGALMTAATGASEGWRVTYLGPDLPAEEIAAAIDKLNARALALSIVYPPDDPNLVKEIRLLRRIAPQEVSLLVGGRAANSYQRILSEVGAVRLSDMQGFRQKLRELRSP